MKDGVAVRASWTLGELAQSEHRRVGTQLCHHHGAVQRVGGSNPPPACPQFLTLPAYDRWLGPEPDPRESAHQLSTRANDHVADLLARELTRQ